MLSFFKNLPYSHEPGRTLTMEKTKNAKDLCKKTELLIISPILSLPFRRLLLFSDFKELLPQGFCPFDTAKVRRFSEP